MYDKIAIVDDHSIVREGIEVLINADTKQDFITCFKDGSSLLEALNTETFDLIITDIQLPDIMGFSLVSKILKIKPTQKILVFSMYPEKIVAKSLLRLGAMGYVNKEEDNETLLEAIDTILSNKRYISPSLQLHFSNKIINRESDENSVDALSNRELEVLILLFRGQGVLEIANILDINPSTVATYKSRILEKLKVRNSIQLYKKCQLLGLV